MIGETTYVVKTCTLRTDGAYLITFRKHHRSGIDVAISREKMDEGDAFTVRPGLYAGYQIADRHYASASAQ